MEGADGVVVSSREKLWIYEGYVDFPLLIAHSIYQLGKRSSSTSCVSTKTGSGSVIRTILINKPPRSHVRPSWSQNNAIQVSTITI